MVESGSLGGEGSVKESAEALNLMIINNLSSQKKSSKMP
jgi:hypothetical protein